MICLNCQPPVSSRNFWYCSSVILPSLCSCTTYRRANRPVAYLSASRAYDTFVPVIASGIMFFPSFVQVSCAPLSETESTRSNSFFSFSIFLLFVVPASMAAGVLPGTQTVILYAPHNADAPGMLYSCSSCSVSGVTAMIARMTSVRYLPPPCEVIHLCTSSGNLICRVRPS